MASEACAAFETIGNATVIVYDGKPILATDPWITDNAYFGSWGHTHIIPDDQMEAIRSCEYVWFSHGHPDHLNGDSLPQFVGKKILLPDHFGSRIKNEILKQGHNVITLRDKEWTRLSEKVRILCLSDYNQDAILLIEVNNRLIVNLNDAGNRGWENFIKKTVQHYPVSFLLALSGYGDADMINFFSEKGERIPPAAAKRFPIGAAIAQKVDGLGCKYFIPFSSLHRYQRSDSAWANEFTTTLDDYSNGYVSKSSSLLPAFLNYNCETDSYSRLHPNAQSKLIRSPEEFGDNWTDELDRAEVLAAEKYLTSIEHLSTFLDFINLRVGGKDNFVSISKSKFDRGITFEAPRSSLTLAIEYEIFDDLLIGNFMKTTLHGNWPKSGLYPNFTPFVAKYADNGRAKTRDEIIEYFNEYRKRAPLNYFRHRVEQRSKDFLRTYVAADSKSFQSAKRIYWDLKKIF